MQRRILLRRGLVLGHTVFVRQWHILPDWQHERDNLSARLALPCARAGQPRAMSDRKLLQCDWSLCICAMYAWLILQCNRPQCGGRTLPRRLLVWRRLFGIHAERVQSGLLLCSWLGRTDAHQPGLFYQCLSSDCICRMRARRLCHARTSDSLHCLLVG